MEHRAGVRLRARTVLGHRDPNGLRAGCSVARGAHGRARAHRGRSRPRKRGGGRRADGAGGGRRGRRARGVRGAPARTYGPRSGVSRGATGGRVVRAQVRGGMQSRERGVRRRIAVAGAHAGFLKRSVGARRRRAPRRAVHVARRGGRASRVLLRRARAVRSRRGLLPGAARRGRRHAASGEAGPRPPRRRARRLPPPILPRAFERLRDGGVRARAEHRGCERGVSVGYVRGAARLLPGSGCGRGRPGDGASQAARRLRHAGRGGRAPRQPRARLRGCAAARRQRRGDAVLGAVGRGRGVARAAPAHRAAALAARGAARRRRRVGAVAVCAGKLP